MKIIFIKDVKGQGKKDDIKEVKEGFGEFLIKSGSAVLYTNKSLEILNKQKEVRKEEETLIKNEALELKRKLEKLNLKFKVKTGKDGKVFGNVSSKQIYEELNKLGYSSIDKRKIFIDHPITSLGTHIVKIELFKDILANVKVKVISK